MFRVGQNHTYTICRESMKCLWLARTMYTVDAPYVIFGREITKYTVKYGVYGYNSGQPYTYI